MVNVTGASQIALQRWIDEQLASKSASGHKHAQGDVDGLTASLSTAEGLNRMTFRGYCTDANAALEIGRYVITPETKNALGGWGLLETHLQVGAVHDNETNWLFQTYYDTNGNVYYRNKINDGAFSTWARFYMAGGGGLGIGEVAGLENALAYRPLLSMNHGIQVPTTGWDYQPAYDMYYQQLEVPGMVAGGMLYADCAVGANFPLIGARCFATGVVMFYMADIPTVSEWVQLKSFSVAS